MNLCERIDFDLAKLLNNRIYADIYDDKYATEDVTVTFDNYLGVQNYKEGEFIDDGDYVHGKYYYAPTYAEVIDWLFNKGIVIEFMPAYTFSLLDRIAYFYIVYKKDDENSKMSIIFQDLEWMSSFELAMKNIVEKLINEKYID